MRREYTIYIWKIAPFVRLLAFLVAGILLQYYIPFPQEFLVISLIISIAFLLVTQFLQLPQKFALRRYNGLPAVFCFIFLGALLAVLHNDKRNKYWYGNYSTDSSRYICVLNEQPVPKSKTWKILAKVIYVIDDSVKSVKGEILLYLKKESSGPSLNIGDTIAFSRQPQDIKNSGNPGAFDYAQYAAFHGYYQQVYLTQNDYLVIGERKSWSLPGTLSGIRIKIKDALYRFIPGEQEKTIAAALLIGYKVDLDKDLVQAYSNAGVVHLIAISGLHMGIIYFLLSWIFARVPGLKRSKFFRSFLVIICLWAFALITGLSGSVLRSACMFSFIAGAGLLHRKISIFNSMAASAFVLLCFNPWLLWDVGFQLSYLAVTGIVVAQRPIANWFVFNNKISKKIWSLMSVSLAAQLFTFPVCIYYFHQLPLLFLLSNLVAIPLTVAALWGCILLVCFMKATGIAVFIGKLVGMIIWLINVSVSFINQVPFSLWDGLKLNLMQTFVLYAVVIFLLHSLLKRNKRSLALFLSGAVLLSAILIFQNLRAVQQRKFVVYDVPAYQAMDFIDGQDFQFAGDSLLRAEGVLRNFHLKPARIALNVNHEKNSGELISRENCFAFAGSTFLLIQTSWHSNSAELVNVDYLVISGNPRLYLEDLVKNIQPSIIIFDSSNPLWKIAKWKKDCERLHLRFHSVPESGAFIASL